TFAFSPDGKTLAAEGHVNRHVGPSDIPPGSITPLLTLWDVATGKVIKQTQGKVDSFFHLRGWSSKPGKNDRHDRTTIGRSDELMSEVDVEVIGMGEARLGGGFPQAASPDGKTVAADGGDGTIRLTVGTKGEDPRLLSQHESEVTSLAFSPDGRYLASGDKDGRVYLWVVSTGKIRWEVVNGKDRDLFKDQDQSPGWRGRISAVSFSPDGSLLITDGESRNRSGAGIYVTCLWRLTDQGKEARPGPLSPRELDDLWADLADADTGTAYRAVVSLIAAPKQATKLLADQARSLSAPHERIARLVADLDDDDFAVR